MQRRRVVSGVSVSTQTPNDTDTADAEVPECRVTPEERHALQALAVGDGVVLGDSEAILKRCSICRKYFFTRFINEHMPGCGRPDGIPRDSSSRRRQTL